LTDTDPAQFSWRRLLAGPSESDAADGLRLRRWFLAFVAWMVILTLAACWAFARYDTGDASAHGIWLIAITLFYLCLCCLFCPLPTAWIVMLLASNQIDLLQPAWLRVAVVAGLCAVATGIANLNEYHIITFLARYGRVGRIRDTRVYRWAARWFAVSPFMVVALFGFLPLPVDVVRWLAVLSRYSRLPYFIAYVVGRFPRYAVWALSAVWLDLNWWQILIVQAVLVLAAGLAILRSVLRKRRARRNTAPDLAGVGRVA